MKTEHGLSALLFAQPRRVNYLQQKDDGHNRGLFRGSLKNKNLVAYALLTEDESGGTFSQRLSPHESRHDRFDEIERNYGIPVWFGRWIEGMLLPIARRNIIVRRNIEVEPKDLYRAVLKNQEPGVDMDKVLKELSIARINMFAHRPDLRGKGSARYREIAAQTVRALRADDNEGVAKCLTSLDSMGTTTVPVRSLLKAALIASSDRDQEAYLRNLWRFTDSEYLGEQYDIEMDLMLDAFRLA